MEMKQIIRNFENRNINCIVLETKEQLYSYLDSQIADGNIVGYGGSMTLSELGVHEYLKNRDITYLNRDAEGADKDQIMHQALSSDVYLASSNAITEKGEIFNIDGNGNRVAAMIYGPKRVILVVGENKIVKSVKDARERVKLIAAPMNAKRLHTNTPCENTGECADCRAAKRMCCSETVINFQRNRDRMYLVIMKGTYGY